MTAAAHGRNLVRSWLTIVTGGWITLAIAAFLLKTLLAPSTLVLLVDRSYCPPETWAAIAQEYATLYRQDQQGQIVLTEVILFSDLGQETLLEPPSPDNFATLPTYGRPARDRQTALLAAHPNARLLSCQTP